MGVVGPLKRALCDGQHDVVWDLFWPPQPHNTPHCAGHGASKPLEPEREIFTWLAWHFNPGEELLVPRPGGLDVAASQLHGIVGRYMLHV